MAINFGGAARKAKIAINKVFDAFAFMQMQYPPHQRENKREQRRRQPEQIVAHAVKTAALNHPVFHPKQVFHTISLIMVLLLTSHIKRFRVLSHLPQISSGL